MSNSQRRVRVNVSPIAIRKGLELPNNSTIVAIDSENLKYGWVEMTIQSSDFPETEEGSKPPLASPTKEKESDGSWSFKWNIKT